MKRSVGMGLSAVMSAAIGVAAGCNDLIGLSPGVLVSDGGAGGSDTCSNGQKDGDETGQDCGGACLQGCADGGGCKVGPDCESRVCSDGGTCQAPACTDDVQNGEETDLDCGGPCGPCGFGKGCEQPGDCHSADCTDGHCGASCDDGEKSGEETGKDCGGGVCAPCPIDEGCAEGWDCESGVCEAQQCVDFHVWSFAYGGLGAETVQHAAMDASGNLLLTGIFLGDTVLAGQAFGNTSGFDSFLLKVDPDGAALWANAFTGNPDIYPMTSLVAALPTGNAVVAGTCLGAFKFGNQNPAPGGSYDIVLGTVNQLGPTGWLQRFGDSAGQSVTGIAVDSFGSIVAAGQIDGVVDFGGGPTMPKGKNDIFVLKVDGGGGWIWNRRLGDIGNDGVGAVAVAPDGGILVSGTFEGTVDFGEGPVSAPGGGPTAFLLKLDPGGNHVWLKLIPAQFLAVTEQGEILVAGTMTSAVDVGCGTMISSGQKDIFVGKLDSNGICTWSKQLGDSNDQSLSSLAVGGDGSVLLTGQLLGTIHMGPLNLMGPSDGDPLGFLAKLDDAGTPVWGRAFEGVGSGGLVVGAASKDVLFVGPFGDSVSLGGEKLLSSGPGDLFAARFRLP